MLPAFAAVFVRLALITVACGVAHISIARFALLHDGWEYLRLARAISHGSLAGLDPATLRLFLGYPALMSVLAQDGFYILAGLVISIACAALCASYTSLLGKDDRLAWWMVAVTPTWLVFSSTVMSDSLALVLVMIGLILIERRKWAWSGLFVGLAFTVRPVGALLMIPLAIEALVEAGPRALLRGFVTALPLPVIYMVTSRIAVGDAMRPVHQYMSQDFAWPLTSLLNAPRNPNMSLFWIVYQFGILAVSWVGGFGLWRRMRAGERGMRPLLVWHVVAGLFYLLLPSSWAFQALDRFYLSIWPTTLIGLAPWLPRKKAVNIGLVLVFGAISFLLAVRWLVNLAAVFPFDARAF